jgi:hypothetical protein
VQTKTERAAFQRALAAARSLAAELKGIKAVAVLRVWRCGSPTFEVISFDPDCSDEMARVFGRPEIWRLA